MKRTLSIVAFILLSLTLFSCHRADLTINQTLVQPYIVADGEMGLAVYLRTSIENPENSSLYVKDPSGDWSWSLPLNELEYDGLKYYGTSDIAMPKGSLLPQGTWNVDLIYKDGRTVSKQIEVSYKDADTVLEKYKGSTGTVFDAGSNLTVCL